MAAVTYYVALAFKKTEDDGGDIVACDPKEAQSADQARSRLGFAGNTGLG